MQNEVDHITDLKRTNRRAILNLLREHGALSRKSLVDQLQLSPAAITKITGEMLQEGLLEEGSRVRNAVGVGRSQIPLHLKADAFCGLGILINVKQVILSAAYLDGSIIFSHVAEVVSPADLEQMVSGLSRQLLSLVEEYAIPRRSIIGIGLAIRGLIDPTLRIVQDSFGALQQTNCPLADMFERETGLRTVMNNNVRALFSTHMFLEYDRHTMSQFFLRCEYGIGAALSINGEIWNGGNGRCAEIGHIPVLRHGGKPCICGKMGCLETIASPVAIRAEALSHCTQADTPLLWRLRESIGEDSIDLNMVLDAARRGDSVVAGIVDRAVRALGDALKGVIYTLDPQEIVLYGNIFENNYFLLKLKTEMEEGLDNDHSNIFIEKSRHNNSLEPLAACVLILEEFFNNGGMIIDEYKPSKAERGQSFSAHSFGV